MALRGLDRIASGVSDDEKFQIDLGEGDYLEFRRLTSYSDLLRAKRKASQRAKEIAPAVIGRATVDQTEIETMSEICLMADLATQKEITPSVLWAFSAKAGMAFAGIVAQFHALMAVGSEAGLFKSAIEDAKKNSPKTDSTPT